MVPTGMWIRVVVSMIRTVTRFVDGGIESCGVSAGWCGVVILTVLILYNCE